MLTQSTKTDVSIEAFRQSIIASGGEAGRLIASFDWANTPVGPTELWPQSLKTAVGMILPSPVPMVLLWGQDGVMLYNDAYSHFAGGRHPELLGSNVREGWPEIAGFNGNVMNVCLAAGTLAYRGQEQTLHRHGRPEQVWMNLNYSPVLGEDGKPAGVLAIVVEVTEQVAAEQRQQKAEAALRAERDRAQGVLDNMDEAFVLLDRNFRFVDINAKAMQLEHRPREALIGLTHWEAHPDAAPELGELFRKGMAERRAVSMEHRYVWPDGRDTWIDMRAYPVGDRLAVFYRDVTERKRTEEGLTKRERELQTLTDALPVLVSYIDADRRYQFNNKVYETWFPRRREDIVGKPVREVVGEAAYAKVAHHMDAALRGERVTFQQFMPYTTTAPRHIEVDYIPREAPDGRVEGFYTLVQDITEREAAKRALLEAQAAAEAEAAERSAILAQLAEGVIVADREGRITFVNEAAERIHGVAQLGVGPARYAEVYNLLTEDGKPYPSDQLPLSRAVLNGETTNDARWRVRHPNGSEIIAVGSARPVLDSAGQQIGAVLTLRDETARDAAERSLRESEARVRALTDNLPSGMVYQITTGIDGSERRFLYVSQSHEKLTGVPAEAVLADPSIPYRLILSEDQPKLVEAEARALRDGTQFDVQVRFRRTDGEVRWSRIISAPRQQLDGSLIWDGIQIDITDEKATADALRAETEALETLNRTGAAIAAELELEKVVQQVTDAAVGLTGAAFGAFFYNVLNEAGESLMLFTLSGANRADFEQFGMPRATAIFHPTFAGEGVVRSDDILADPRYGKNDPHQGIPENHLPVRSYLAVSVTSRSGEVLGGLFFGHPEPGRFTERHERLLVGLAAQAAIAIDNARLFQAVQRANETLEARVTERTGELTLAHEALRQSQKMEAMGQLTGGVAHDFNNLLTPIVAVLDRLERQGLGGEREQRLIAGAAQSADRAKTLVQRLLAFARRQPLQTTAVDVAELVTGMADLVASTIGPQIRVAVDLPQDLPSAKADANQLEMALLNLSVNARDAMPDGGTLRITATAETLQGRNSAQLRPGAYIRLSVADSGIGMDEATLARAVEPFFSTKGVGKGTGLGLSMVHGLVSQLGGAMTINSQPGLGTNVELWLPQSEAAPERVTPRPDVEPGPSARGTVLLVDDEELVRLSTSDMLSELGYAVVEAASAREALTLLSTGVTPHLLVTDHLMPGMSGTDLARQVGAERPEMAILIVSGYAESTGIEPDLPRLTKPFRKDELAAALAKLGGLTS